MKKRFILLGFITSILLLISGCSQTSAKVYFDSLGGTDIPSIFVSEIKDEASLTPTKEGYDFQYWAYDISFLEEATLDSLKNLKTNKTVYAYWQPTEYTITYNNLEDQTHTNQSVYTVEDSSFQLKAPSNRSYYNFLGWKLNPEATTFITEIDTRVGKNITLYAIYEPINYTITYVDPLNQTNLNPTIYNIEMDVITFTPLADLSDYDFLGWSLSETEHLILETLDVMTYQNFTLYALWESTVDSQAPVITGLESIDYTIGNQRPNLLEGVTATDDFDGEVTFTFDDSKVDYEQPGSYIIDYSAIDKAGNQALETRTIYVFETIDGYYQSATGLSGESLKLELRSIINDGFSGVNYGAARDILQITDRDPNNPSNLIDFYTGNSLPAVWDNGGTWNREHVWPQSLLGVSASNNVVNEASDLQNLTPSNPSTNTSRGNKYFDIVTNTQSYYPTRSSVRGDIARILLYMETMYIRYNLVNTDPKINEMGKLSTLLKWHIEDPVDDFERNRNEVIFSYQGNRNPYIDHPEFVEMIYGVIVLDSDTNQYYFFEVLYVDPSFNRKNKFIN